MHLTGAVAQSLVVENSLIMSGAESFRWGKMLEWKEERREWRDSRTEERLEEMRSVSSVRASRYIVLRLRPSLVTLSPPSLGRKREEGSVVLEAAALISCCLLEVRLEAGYLLTSSDIP